jgi:hypothetical protein
MCATLLNAYLYGQKIWRKCQKRRKKGGKNKVSNTVADRDPDKIRIQLVAMNPDLGAKLLPQMKEV